MSKLMGAIQRNRESILQDWLKNLKSAVRRRDLISEHDLGGVRFDTWRRQPAIETLRESRGRLDEGWIVARVEQDRPLLRMQEQAGQGRKDRLTQASPPNGRRLGMATAAQPEEVGFTAPHEHLLRGSRRRSPARG